MRIDHADLKLIELPLIQPFETSFGVDTVRTIILLTLSSEGVHGFSESVMDPLPLFREETIAGAWDLIRNVFLPRLLGKDLPDAQALVESLAMFRGNNQAKAVVEMAFWDLWARSLKQPLYRLLGGDRTFVPVGVSLGIKDSIEKTIEQVQLHLEQGYQRIKLKIKPGWDVNLVSAVRKEFPHASLTVDANSAYTLADISILKELDAFDLDYIEQPLAFDDILDHAQLQSRLKTALCLDESILTAADARKALQINACRVINIKVARVGGHLEARKVHDVAAASSVPVWCGGMLEGGVGRAHNIHLATLPNFTKPGDTSSSSRYWTQDIINEPLETKNGFMPVPPGFGTGVSLNTKFIDQLALRHESFNP